MNCFRFMQLIFPLQTILYREMVNATNSDRNVLNVNAAVVYLPPRVPRKTYRPSIGRYPFPACLGLSPWYKCWMWHVKGAQLGTTQYVLAMMGPYAV